MKRLASDSKDQKENQNDFSNGEQAAFASIYYQNASDLYRYAKKNIDSKEDCEEIVQDVFESLWSRRDELKHVIALRAYLFKMVRFKVIRYFQHEGVKRKYLDHYKLFEVAYDSMTEANRNPNLIQETILKIIETLPERCQFAFKLRLQENLTNAEIAKRMKIKITTVENYFVMAIRHLRSQREVILGSLADS